MRLFKNMLQVAKTKGIKAFEVSFSPDLAFKKFLDACDLNEVFVFDNKFIQKKKKGPDDFIDYFKQVMEARPKPIPEDEELKIDPPFSVFSIENMSGSLTVPYASDNDKISIHCIMVEEIPEAFEKRIYYALVEINGEVSVWCTENKKFFNNLVALKLDSIKKDEIGLKKNLKENVSFRNPKNKKQKRNISKKQMYIVCNKEARTAYEERDKQKNERVPIQWDAAHSVIGHWRHYRCLACRKDNFNNGAGCPVCNYSTLRTTYTGVDRNGNKIVGKTWISHYVKNKDKELVKKVRLVKN